MGAAVLGSSSAHSEEKVRYLRDWISIPLRETTNPDSTIIHKGVVSGAALAVLESDEKAGATRVRTDDGVEGWLPTRYLTTEPGARSQLDKAQLEIERLGKLNEQLRLGAPSVAALQESSAKQMADAQVQNNKLNDEVATLKRSIGDNSKLVQDHADLGKHAAELQEQVVKLNTEIVELRAGQRQSYFRDGALSVGAGALLTLLAAHFWPRKKRSDWA
jgi:SH3 domain protein